MMHKLGNSTILVFVSLLVLGQLSAPLMVSAYEITDITVTTKWTFNTGTQMETSPAIGDLVGDSHYEIVVADNYNKTIYCLDYQGNLLWNTTLPKIIESSPVIRDINDDGTKEVLIAASDFLCYTNLGVLLWNVSVSGEIFRTEAAVADINNDGNDEIVIHTQKFVFCLDGQGHQLWNYTTTGSLRGTALLVDLNNDNHLEVLLGNENTNVTCLNDAGSYVWHYYSGKYISGSMQAADLGNDGKIEVVFGAQDTFFCLNATGFQQWNYTIPSTTWGFDKSTPTISDLTNNGKLEILIGDLDGYLYCIEENGSLLWHYDVGNLLITQPRLYDFNTDGTFEIVITNNRLHFLYANGTTISDYSMSAIYSDAILFDFDLNGKVDLLFNTYPHMVFLTELTVTENVPEPTPSPSPSPSTSGSGLTMVFVISAIAGGMTLLVIARRRKHL